MKQFLCVSKKQREWDYYHANWMVINAETPGKAKAEYCRLDGDTDFTDVSCRINIDSQMEAKIAGQWHPLAVSQD